MKQKGFTLLEILIAVTLLALVYYAIPSDFTGSSREQLEASVEKITRAIRFAQNESVLRNTIVRLKLNITNEDEQSYSVDYGPSDTLPLPEIKVSKSLSIKEREDQLKLIQDVDRQFNPVEEMDSAELSFPSSIVIQGVGLADREFVQTEDFYSLYFYPTGEKDSSIIFLTSIEELGMISVQSFTESPDVSYSYLEEESVDYIERQIKKYYDEWRKN